MGILTLLASICGYSEDAKTYASNVCATWRSLKTSYTNPPSQAWLNAHAVFVKNYGPPASTESEQYDRSLKAYIDGIDNALADGFLDGVSSFPAVVGNAIGGTAASFWSGIPAWLKWATGAALVLLALSILTRAGILGPKVRK